MCCVTYVLLGGLLCYLGMAIRYVRSLTFRQPHFSGTSRIGGSASIHGQSNTLVSNGSFMNSPKHKDIWHEITSHNGIAELMEMFGQFHDGCIRELHIVTGHSVDESLSMTCDWPTTIHMLVQRQKRSPSALELRFEEVAELRIRPPQPGYESIIFAAFFVLRDEVFYWADDGRWSLESREPKDASWIAARRVWWRDASAWMGHELRYRT